MRIPIFVRQSFAGVLTFHSAPVEVSEAAVVLLRTYLHAISGSGAQVVFSLETSDDLDNWDPVGNSLTMDTEDTIDSDGITAAVAFYGSYMRVKVVITGTSPALNCSVYLLTHASS